MSVCGLYDRKLWRDRVCVCVDYVNERERGIKCACVD